MVRHVGRMFCLDHAHHAVAHTSMDDNAHLGHGICAELAPIVSAAKQYEQIQTDIAQTNHNIPIDSAARHFLHHNASLSLASPATVKPVITLMLHLHRKPYIAKIRLKALNLTLMP